MPKDPEPFNEVKEGIINLMMLHDEKRVLKPSAVLNRVIFDSIEPNPAWKDKDKKDNKDKPKSPATSNLVFQYYEPSGADDDTLIFESRFESGNLRRAIQVYVNEYDLILRPDINTRGHTQWFYFSIKNMRRGRKYKFNIINLLKPDSVYNQGLLPLLYSDKEAESTGVGWHRCGSDVAYFQNGIKRKNGCYYTLTFSVSFPHDGDTAYLAHCYPYTYTDLRMYLRKLEADPQRSNCFRRRTLCSTLAGNDCDLLTVTSFSSDPESLKARKGILISARVHPGETQASWMMKGIIDYLTGPTLDARILRDNFVFKIVPMLNPDGVINGNYRCSLSGQDLNRQWLSPSRTMHPTIYYTKLMLKRFLEDRQVVLFVDLHGHSRKKNVFVYGCDSRAEIRGCGPGPARGRMAERIFPRMLWRSSDIFSFSDCSFKVQRCKESSARVVVWRECQISNSYTLEASYAGANFGPQAGQHLTTRAFEAMGYAVCDAILDYFDPDQTKYAECQRELQVLYPEGDDREGGSSGDDSSSGDEAPADPAAAAAGDVPNPGAAPVGLGAGTAAPAQGVVQKDRKKKAATAAAAADGQRKARTDKKAAGAVQRAVVGAAVQRKGGDVPRPTVRARANARCCSDCGHSPFRCLHRR